MLSCAPPGTYVYGTYVASVPAVGVSASSDPPAPRVVPCGFMDIQSFGGGVSRKPKGPGMFQANQPDKKYASLVAYNSI